MTKQTKAADTLAGRIISEILDKGLADSTWRDQHPDAYQALLWYRLDLEGSVEKHL